MTDDELGVELLRLYRELRAEPDPKVKAALRQLIDAKLDRAQTVMPASYVGVARDRRS